MKLIRALYVFTAVMVEEYWREVQAVARSQAAARR